MIYFSPAKINIGLQILNKRTDGYHNIQSVMHPVGLCDILEINILPTADKGFLFSQSGIRFEGDQEDNLCLQAMELFRKETQIPPVQMHLHKQIPVGAGLGGGSSNASTTLLGLNALADNPLSVKQLGELAAILGSDCPFFLDPQSMLMEGRGEILSPLFLSMEEIYLVLLFPEIHVSTQDAYAGVIPAIPPLQLKELIKEPLSRWEELIENDFEKSVFKRYPQLVSLKRELYSSGASYASLSGSGSSLYGLFKKQPSLPDGLQKYVIWEGPTQTRSEDGL
jgi:4-diphosphocytidyl-2-C-methyl-D-erythritol kinase